MEEIKDGIFTLSEAYYRPLPGLNQSSIPHLLKSGAHYLANLSEPKSTAALDFGNAFHTYVLEPKKFANEYVVEKIDGRTNKGKLRKLEIEASNLKTIDNEDFYCIKKMDENIKKHLIASKLLVDGYTEKVIKFKLRASNGNTVNCKAKIDYLLSGGIIDLKNSRDSVDITSFSRTIEKWNYHIQGSFYSHGIETLSGSRPDFIFIAVEDVAPFAVNVIKLSDDHYFMGYTQVYKAVDIYEKCVRENKWPAYPEVVHESKISKWLK